MHIAGNVPCACNSCLLRVLCSLFMFIRRALLFMLRLRIMLHACSVEKLPCAGIEVRA